MPIDYRIEPEEGRIVITLSGAVSTEEQQSSLAVQLADPEFRSDLDRLIDRRRLERSMSQTT